MSRTCKYHLQYFFWYFYLFSLSSYGSLLDFRPPPILPNQVYRFDPATGEVRVVATDFNKCNGIAFTPDGKTAYV